MSTERNKKNDIAILARRSKEALDTIQKIAKAMEQPQYDELLKMMGSLSNQVLQVNEAIKTDMDNDILRPKAFNREIPVLFETIIPIAMEEAERKIEEENDIVGEDIENAEANKLMYNSNIDTILQEYKTYLKEKRSINKSGTMREMDNTSTMPVEVAKMYNTAK